MANKIKWPQGKTFAFTVVDDTDGATVENVRPVYQYLFEKGIFTTKTVWVYPSRDHYQGESLSDEGYRHFVQDLSKKGFEIGFHNAGSGGFTRDETLAALEFFKETLGFYPKLHINHGENEENLYWGSKRFSPLFQKLYGRFKPTVHSRGDEKDSPYFWGDKAKEHITYIRNRVFRQVNTLQADNRFPTREYGKDTYLWFSSSDGLRLSTFLSLLSKKNLDTLEKEGGVCIVYTHFGYDFVDEEGHLNQGFKDTIDDLSARNGWFVPASELLDFLQPRVDTSPSRFHAWKLDVKWLFQRAIHWPRSKE